jgi:hypothetical protein
MLDHALFKDAHKVCHIRTRKLSRPFLDNLRLCACRIIGFVEDFTTNIVNSCVLVQLLDGQQEMPLRGVLPFAKALPGDDVLLIHQIIIVRKGDSGWRTLEGIAASNKLLGSNSGSTLACAPA